MYRSHMLRLSMLILLVLATLAVVSATITYLPQKRQKSTPSIHVTPLPNMQVPLSSVSAESVYILDTTNGHILGQKNAQYRFSAASTTKLMTSLIALTVFKPTDVLVASESAQEGTKLGLTKGNSLTFLDALYAMLLPSNNDVALLMADNYPGGKSAFIAAMNDMAKHMHLQRTTFADPAGLEDESGYTTAQELTQIAAVFMTHPLLARVVATVHYDVYVNGIGKVVLINTNKLLGYHGIQGVKTGTTEEAKEVLVTSLPLKGHNILITVMKSDDRFADTRFIVDYLLRTYLNSPSYLQ